MTARQPKKAKPQKRRERRAKVLDAVQLKAAKLLGSAGYVRGMRRKNNVVPVVAHECGIHPDTLYQWMRDNPNFELTIEAQRLKLLEKADRALDELLTGKMLETRDGQVWVPPDKTLVIFVKKNLDAMHYDDQLRRDKRRRKHDKEMVKLKSDGLKDALEEFNGTIVFSERKSDD